MKRQNISKNVGFALVDVKTKAANAVINKMRDKGDYIHVTLSGYLQGRDWSRWDGVSVEQGMDVISCTIKTVRSKKVKTP